MKKLLSIMAASAMLICTLSSCADKKIVGKWSMNSLTEESGNVNGGGLDFKKDGKGSFFMDTTPIFYAEGKELKIRSGDEYFTFGDEYIDYDGTKLSVNVEKQDMLTLERISGKSKDDCYDGEYKLLSGLLYDTLAGNISNDPEKKDISVIVDIDGSNTEIKYEDIFDYTAEKGKLNLNGMVSFLGEDDAVVELDYEIKGDTLKITGKDGDTEELKRMES